ncbi:MAG: aldehyde dehydrogenase family protein, partial [Bacteroidales bacterium]
MKTIQERIDSVIQLQRDFFASGATKDPEMRKNQLLKLKHVIQKYEKEISEALFLDLHKSPEESFLTEIQVVLSEIDYHIKHLTRWCKPRKVPFSLFTFPGQGRIIHEPYGHVLIIAPWNYPFQLLMSPLVGAISAGNCIILKPSPLSAHTSALMAKMISEYFPERYIALFEGDIPVNQALLSHPFDYIFFTGGPGFGKYVAGCAAAHLTPVTLELGGKSP